VPKAEINDGFIPNINHLASHGSSLSQPFLGRAFKGMDILFFLAAGGGQPTERASAQLQDIEMSGGISLFLEDGIMTGGLVPVTVTGVDVKIIQLGEHRQLVGQTSF